MLDQTKLYRYPCEYVLPSITPSILISGDSLQASFELKLKTDKDVFSY